MHSWPTKLSIGFLLLFISFQQLLLDIQRSLCLYRYIDSWLSSAWSRMCRNHGLQGHVRQSHCGRQATLARVLHSSRQGGRVAQRRW